MYNGSLGETVVLTGGVLFSLFALMLGLISLQNIKVQERQDECAVMAQRANLNATVSSLLLKEVCSSLTEWELRGIKNFDDFKQATEVVALRRLDRHRRRGVLMYLYRDTHNFALGISCCVDCSFSLFSRSSIATSSTDPYISACTCICKASTSAASAAVMRASARLP